MIELVGWGTLKGGSTTQAAKENLTRRNDRSETENREDDGNSGGGFTRMRTKTEDYWGKEKENTSKRTGRSQDPCKAVAVSYTHLDVYKRQHPTQLTD